MREGLEDEDRVKLETWFQVMNLLEHYRALTFDPTYQSGLKLLSSAHAKAMRATKIEVIRKGHNRLISRWEGALGSDWRSSLEQD